VQAAIDDGLAERLRYQLVARGRENGGVPFRVDIILK
jgi:hypothetical protein